MPFGPGRYDDLASELRSRTEAEGIVLILVNAHIGSGFSLQGTAEALRVLPDAPREAAERIEEDLRKAGVG